MLIMFFFLNFNHVKINNIPKYQNPKYDSEVKYKFSDENVYLGKQFD